MLRVWLKNKKESRMKTKTHRPRKVHNINFYRRGTFLASKLKKPKIRLERCKRDISFHFHRRHSTQNEQNWWMHGKAPISAFSDAKWLNSRNWQGSTEKTGTNPVPLPHALHWQPGAMSYELDQAFSPEENLKRTTQRQNHSISDMPFPLQIEVIIFRS